jgi:hypothetical protein
MFDQKPLQVPHSTRAIPREELPEGSRSYAGVLICDHKQEILVDQDVIKPKMDYLTQFVAIACFVGGVPPMAAIPSWLLQLQWEVGGGLTMGWNLGKGFFLIKASHTDQV